MKPKENSPSNEFLINTPNSIPLSSLNQTKNISIIPSYEAEENNMIESQEGDDLNDFINFDVSFFLSNDIYKNIVGDDDNSDNKNNINSNNNSICNTNQKDKNSSGINNINDNYLELNQNNIPGFQNINDNNKDINLELNNNLNNLEENNFSKVDNFNQDNNSFSALNNYNYNNTNYLVNNNTPINIQYNNNISNNYIYSPNYTNLTNYPQIPNNQPLFSYQNSLITQNITNNYIFNNNSEIPAFYYQNKYKNNKLSLYKIKKKNYNKPKKKKPFNEYITIMFGRRGWICELCNNFNYETRKKCNRCHMLKKARKIDEFYQTKLNNSSGYKNYWTCKYCGNFNYSFRLACNRCQAKK